MSRGLGGWDPPLALKIGHASTIDTLVPRLIMINASTVGESMIIAVVIRRKGNRNSFGSIERAPILGEGLVHLCDCQVHLHLTYQSDSHGRV